MRVDPKHLQNCVLWEGSSLHLIHKHSALSIDDVRRKFQMYQHLEEADHLTKREREYKAALELTLKEHEKT